MSQLLETSPWRIRVEMLKPLENPMRKMLTVVGTSLGLLLSQPIVSQAQTPDAVIELSGGSVAFALLCLCLLIGAPAIAVCG
jgi:hypothetical protein